MKIGELTLQNNICLAPMAGITDLVFRTIARKFGCALCFTEMVSSNGLVRYTKRSYRYMETSSDDRPLGVQIFGSDPGILSSAAEIVSQSGADLIDINMGCPVKKVIKTGAGAALMKDPSKIAAIVREVRKVTSLPLTIKIRSGWRKSGINAVEIASIAEDCGVDAVIIHPRTVEQGFSGCADWNLISEVKQRVGVPVIGSGDVRSPRDALRMLDMSGCDGVMVGRAALGNPWIFRDIADYISTRDITSPATLKEREDVIREHLRMSVNYFGKEIGVKNFRKHLLWYTKGLKGGAPFRQKAVYMNQGNDLLAAVHEYFTALGQDNTL